MWDELIEQVTQQLKKQQSIHEYRTVVIPVEIGNFKELLDSTDEVFYFQGPDEEFIAIHSCVDIEASTEGWIESCYEQFLALIPKLDIINPENIAIRPRIVGGIAFNQSKQSVIWKDFQPVDFFLPTLFIHRNYTDNQVTAIISLRNNENPLGVLHDVISQLKVHSTRTFNSDTNKIKAIEYPISENDWKETIDSAHQMMSDRGLEKVVLSRSMEIVTSFEPDPYTIMTNLSINYPQCYKFYYKSKSSRFFGASPELLVDVNDTKISTLALAGTRPRGLDTADDLRLEQELLTNTKENHEHSLVVQEIIDVFDNNSIEYAHTPEIMKLSNVQHLATPIQVVMDHNVPIFEIIEQMHPTPALGGKPKPMAMDFIKSIEPHYRGLYAAPLGWIDTNLDGKLIVGIRSALNRGMHTWLYAGAGIMPDSDATREWDEIELKFRPILEALGVKL